MRRVRVVSGQVEERFDTEFERLGQASKEEGDESGSFLPGLVKPNPVLPDLSGPSAPKQKVGGVFTAENS